MRFDKSSALCSLRPTASFAVVNGEIQWFDTIQTQPTESELATEIVRLQAEYNNKQYQRDRVKEYPPLAEQLDMLWHAMEQDPTKRLEPFYSSIKDIKDAYPK
jgi:hypothetical protein